MNTMAGQFVEIVTRDGRNEETFVEQKDALIKVDISSP